MVPRRGFEPPTFGLGVRVLSDVLLYYTRFIRKSFHFLSILALLVRLVWHDALNVTNGGGRMGLVLRKNSKWWYGRYKAQGKDVCKNLQVEVRGIAPSTLRDVGSARFENSRGEAQAAFDSLMGEIRSGRSNEALAQAVYEARTGRRVARYALADLQQVWLDKPRRRPPSESHRADCVEMLSKFELFIRGLDPHVTMVDQLRPDHVRAFLGQLDDLGMSASRWNKYLDLLKSVFRRVGVTAANDLINREAAVIFREPYSIEELHAIFEAAKESDPMMYSLAVTAACTAMRRKDCCFLRWSSVDFAAGFVTVKTSKTGVTVDVPIADMLRVELERQSGVDPVFVFPDARRQYLADSTALSKRFRVVLRMAGFDDANAPVTECQTDEFEPAQLDAAAERIFSGPKLARVRRVLVAYLRGKSIKATASVLAVSPGTVSSYLNDLEAESGVRFIRGKRRPMPQKSMRGAVNRPREKGMRAASVRDFHSFRTTFVTLALTNGMPIDTVKMLTGHKTTEIVTKHYFRPERESIRQAMQATMPGLLAAGGAGGSPTIRARDLLESMTAENWEAVRDEVLEVLEVL